MQVASIQVSGSPTLPTAVDAGLSAAKWGRMSPLTLADGLITLAQDADRLGRRDVAGRLVALALSVLDGPTVQ